MRRRIVYFTKYTQAGPASRYRSYQYFSYFEKEGYEIISKPLFPDKYINILYGKGRKSVSTIIVHYIKRLFQLLFLKKFDIIYIEYELFPFVPFFLEKWLLKGRKNIIIDYDDAIFHIYDNSGNAFIRKFFSNKIFKLVQLANAVIAGSPYLTNTLKAYNNNITEIPTSVIYRNYNKYIDAKKRERFRIGWIGSTYTSCFIGLVTEAFKKIQQKYDVEFVLIGFDKHQKHLLDGINYTLEEWNEETEIALLHSLDAGIMPLANEPFAKGKCGFKLIQYMACGIPTISTPLEANVKINRNGKNLHATTTEEWISCFESMIAEKNYFKNITGKENKEIVKEFYSVEKNYKQYLSIFDSLLNPQKICLTIVEQKVNMQVSRVAETEV